MVQSRQGSDARQCLRTARSAVGQTHTIPIVFVALGDPVATGVVASLARPGGNATGFMNPEPSISGVQPFVAVQIDRYREARGSF
ncbi:MAG TPA: ABC transporter substrate binding protein [Pseudomonadota bacterium]|nr:ABC transporter substrate binding protein [Pseudomonadota bacterium]